LRSPRHCAQDEHFTYALEAKKELGEKSVERGPALFNASIRDGVARAFGRRNPSESQLSKVPGKRGLGNIPSPLEEELPEILLAADDPGVDDLQDRIVTFALVGHWR
jgi:hypothetical protein